MGTLGTIITCCYKLELELHVYDDEFVDPLPSEAVEELVHAVVRRIVEPPVAFTVSYFYFRFKIGNFNSEKEGSLTYSLSYCSELILLLLIMFGSAKMK